MTRKTHQLVRPRTFTLATGRPWSQRTWTRLVANFAEEAVQISPAGVRRGRDGIREGFIQLFKDLPQANWEMRTTLFGGDVLFLEWSATSGTNRAEHGVDTFVFRDGLIQAQTVRYALTPNDQ